jgi:hypothetical protein
MALVDTMKDNGRLDSDEWSAVLPESETEIPTFGIEEQADPEPGDEAPEGETDEQRLAREQQELEAGSSLTAEQLAEKEQQERDQNGGKTLAEIKVEQDAAAAKENEDKLLKEKLRQEFLKEMGFENEDELKALKNPPKEETEEEKRIKAEKYEVSFQQHAVDQGWLTLQEINTYKQLSALKPNDLVYADFANTYKQEFADRKDGEGKDEPVTDEEIQEAFQDLYHTNSENKAMKAAGEKSLASRAKEILGDAENKIKGAQADYATIMDKKAQMPAYKAMARDVIKSVLPEKFTYEVDGRKISVDLDGKDFDEIEQTFKNDILFNRFYSSTDKQGLKKEFESGVQRIINDKYIKIVAAEANRQGFSEGQKAAKIGARAPFEQKPAGAGVKVVSNKLTPEERQRNKANLT